MTDAQLDRIRARAGRGMSGAQIATALELPVREVNRALRRMRQAGELPPIGNPVTPDEVEAVRRLWKAGTPIRDIAAQVGRPIGTVATITARLRASGEIGLRTGPQAAIPDTSTGTLCGGVSPPTL